MNDPVMMWIIIGAGLIVFEAATAPGIGLFLAGLGALSTAIIVESRLVEIANTPAQFAWFFGLTTLWALALWKPFKRFRTSHMQKGPVDSPKVQEIVGSIAVIGKQGLKRGEMGQAHWSGTLLSAKLDDGELDDFLPEGTNVRINSITGTVVKVSPLPRE